MAWLAAEAGGTAKSKRNSPAPMTTGEGRNPATARPAPARAMAPRMTSIFREGPLQVLAAMLPISIPNPMTVSTTPRVAGVAKLSTSGPVSTPAPLSR